MELENEHYSKKKFIAIGVGLLAKRRFDAIVVPRAEEFAVMAGAVSVPEEAAAE